LLVGHNIAAKPSAILRHDRIQRRMTVAVP
jgi:hypothetical protein